MLCMMVVVMGGRVQTADVDWVANLDSNAIKMRDSKERKSIVKLSQIAMQCWPGTERYARGIVRYATNTVHL